MDFTAQLFPVIVPWAANALALLILAGLVWRVPWRRLDSGAASAWMGAGVMIMVLWMLNGTYKPGLSFHLLGMAVLTLMMGTRLALLASALVVLATWGAGRGAAQTLGLNWMVCGLTPVCVVTLMLRLAQRYLPANLFVYVFLNAFLAGGLSMIAASLAGCGLLGVSGVYTWKMLSGEALPYYFLLAWSEAFLTGLMMVILVVYRPGWVATFDDARYLSD
jgi:uncharacterized membrane protein